MPVPMPAKRQALAGRVKTAAERHVPHSWVVSQEHRLASEYGAVSRRDRREVMVPSDGDRDAYAEVLCIGSETIRTDTGGQAREVAHTFQIWLVYEFEDGVTSSTWDDITEGTDPDGVATDLRQTRGYYDTPEGRILYQQPDFSGPQGGGNDIIPLGDSGGQQDRAHRLQGTIRIDDFHR